MGRERIRIVLVEPQSPGNVGAVARAMKNMGFGRLTVVNAPRLDVTAARVMAVHATEVLEGLRRTPDLPGAIEGCGLVVGTCGRAAVALRGAASPRDLAPEIVAASDTNDVALVFGREDHGLSNDDLKVCQRILSIPTNADYASLNLAQAVLVCVYEIFLAAVTAGDAATTPVRALAPSERLELMYEKLEAALRAIGYLQRDTAEHMMRGIRQILGRATLDDRDVQIFLGVARQIDWVAARAGIARD